SLTFGGNKTISYLPASGGNPEITCFTTNPYQNINLCFTPTVQLNQFPGLIQSSGDISGDLNVMSMGFNGTNCIIDMANTAIQSSNAPGLLINHFCGKNVSICTGIGGNIQLTSTGKVGIGIQAESTGPKLDINGNVKIRTIEPPTSSNYTILVADDNNIICKKNLT
ncbi:MAG: hypothetical protein GW876_08390, partial [Bacteroidetes bacterium]|nr:hypothetical protein [Bacteroidota bacterium]